MTHVPPAGFAAAREVLDGFASGQTADLTTCDREAIHLPGAIQPHGVLLALVEADLTIRQASSNCGAVLGVEASALIGAPLHAAVGPEFVGRLRTALEEPRATGDDPLSFTAANDGACEAVWHRIDDLVVLELEPVGSSATVAMSTLFEDVRHAINALEDASGVHGLCTAAASELKTLTGYDRVMVYQFHPDEHGEVVAEACEPGLEPYLGQHYPASDIPRQARKLYELKALGVIVDVDYEPAKLVGAPDALEGDPLNLSFATLRSVSPVHLAYLRNMAVRASLTISLMRGPRLWGMITCHHGAPKRVDAQLRAACQLLGRLFSLQLVREEEEEQREYRARLREIETQIVARMTGAEDLAGALAAAGPSPLELVRADGMVACIDGRTVTAGTVVPARAVATLLARLGNRPETSCLVSHDLVHRFGEHEPFSEHAAGVLAIRLSGDLEDYIVWHRRGREHTVIWGGNPEKPMIDDPTSRPGVDAISPRTSFRAWAQEVSGHCEPWSAAEVAAARGLAAAIPNLLLARARDRLAHLAIHDGLTGLPNRALLFERIEEALRHPKPTENRVALLFIDLDRFKLVNDTLGHAAGDALLRQASERLKAATRASDTVARLGGDEFVVLCNVVSSTQAEHLAQRIIHAFETPFALDGDHDTLVTASVGIAITEANASAAELLHDADIAMYRAKHRGRDAAVSPEPEMTASTPGRA